MHVGSELNLKVAVVCDSHTSPPHLVSHGKVPIVMVYQTSGHYDSAKVIDQSKMEEAVSRLAVSDAPSPSSAASPGARGADPATRSVHSCIHAASRLFHCSPNASLLTRLDCCICV